jgi:hypothetical protein
MGRGGVGLGDPPDPSDQLRIRSASSGGGRDPMTVTVPSDFGYIFSRLPGP